MAKNGGPYAKKLKQAAELGQSGQIDRAQAICNEVLAQSPNHPRALHLLGLAAFQKNDIETAESLLQKALEANPFSAEVSNHLAVVYCQKGDLEKGINVYQRALRLNNKLPDLHYNLVQALTRKGDISQAEVCSKRAIDLFPQHPLLVKQLAGILNQQNKSKDALELFKRDAHEEDAEFVFQRGMTHQSMGENEQAIQCYQRALVLKPNFPEAHNNLAIILGDIGMHQKALKHYENAVRAKSDFIPAHKNWGDLLLKLDKYSEAVKVYTKGLELDSNNAELLNTIAVAYRNDCNWERQDYYKSQLIEEMNALLEQDKPCGVPPFVSLSMGFDDETIYRIAKNHAAHTFKKLQGQIHFDHANRSANKKLRIGYVSADFRDHPVGHLLPGVIEKHDRSQFEVYCYSIGVDDNSAYRKRILDATDKFLDLQYIDSESCAKRIYEDNIDVLIDLMGYTQHARPEIFALKPAPVQVGYLGYPSTSGAAFMDYYISDLTALPESQHQYFSEKIIAMPHTYFATDDQMQIAEVALSKAQCGLPEDVFVYCCFCTHYKIDRAVFAAWMKILAQSPKSVLWLYSRSKEFEANLRAEAGKEGIDPERLVFATRQPKDRHLYRHRYADVFLDTFIYNAHTTAIDALWAGVPLITLPGNSMATRVSAALLKSIGLSDLIASSVSDYVKKAVDIRGNIQTVRANLEKNKTLMPLFNTAQYTKDLEEKLRNLV